LRSQVVDENQEDVAEVLIPVNLVEKMQKNNL